MTKLGPYHSLQPYGLSELMGALVLIPFAWVTTVTTAYLIRKIADDWFFKWVRVDLLALYIKLIRDFVWA